MAARTTILRVATGSRCTTAVTRTPASLLVPNQKVARIQKAWYAIPPHDKKQDDLGGPYGQESPHPDQRKAVNKGMAGRVAMVLGLGLGFVAIFALFTSPRQLANHQIEKGAVTGAPKSNPGASLAAVKRKDGVLTTHQLHEEQTGRSSVLGTK